MLKLKLRKFSTDLAVAMVICYVKKITILYFSHQKIMSGSIDPLKYKSWKALENIKYGGDKNFNSICILAHDRQNICIG